MPDERLEFSAQDLGRLARYLGEPDMIVHWLNFHATDAEEARRVREAFFDGYNER